MRSFLIVILPLIVSSCAGHDAGTALEIKARSKASQSRLWSSVDSVVAAFAKERGFRLMHESHGASAKPRFKTYTVEPPHEPAATSILVYRRPEDVRPDHVTIDISEIGVHRPSSKHLEIQRALKTRLEAAGLVVSPTEPSLVITF